MWPVLVQLLPNTVEKTMLEDTRFFPHDGESRGGRGGERTNPVALSCGKAWGIRAMGLLAYRAGPGVGCGKAHGNWDQLNAYFYQGE